MEISNLLQNPRINHNIFFSIKTIRDLNILEMNKSDSKILIFLKINVIQSSQHSLFSKLLYSHIQDKNLLKC